MLEHTVLASVNKFNNNIDLLDVSDACADYQTVVSLGRLACQLKVRLRYAKVRLA